jgi:hypothetical protein
MWNWIKHQINCLKFWWYRRKAVQKEVYDRAYIIMPYTPDLWDIAISKYGESYLSPLRFSHKQDKPTLTKNPSKYEELLFTELLAYWKFRQFTPKDKMLIEVK